MNSSPPSVRMIAMVSHIVLALGSKKTRRSCCTNTRGAEHCVSVHASFTIPSPVVNRKFPSPQNLGHAWTSQLRI